MLTIHKTVIFKVYLIAESSGKLIKITATYFADSGTIALSVGHRELEAASSPAGERLDYMQMASLQIKLWTPEWELEAGKSSPIPEGCLFKKKKKKKAYQYKDMSMNPKYPPRAQYMEDQSDEMRKGPKF